jgi:hypothetical protein
MYLRCVQLLPQDKELLAGRSALLAAQRAVAERSAAITAAKQELLEAKRRVAHQSALLDAVAHDIAYVSCASAVCYHTYGLHMHTAISVIKLLKQGARAQRPSTLLLNACVLYPCGVS